MFVSELMGNLRIPPAALIESTEGATYCPSLSRLICATPSPLDTAKSKERYPTEPSVWLTAAATPSLPSPPVPTGHCTALSAPTFDSHSGLSFESQEVKTFVVPDSSDRCATAIGVEGRVTPEFCWAISGSFHVFTLPRKMSAAVGPSSLRPVSRPWTLYAMTTPPSTVGISRPGAGSADSSSALRGASEAPKSTVLAVNWVTP